jgi:hypothetical protein
MIEPIAEPEPLVEVPLSEGDPGRDGTVQVAEVVVQWNRRGGRCM